MPDYSLSSLTAALPDWDVRLLPRTASTNRWALRALQRGKLAAPAVVVARNQTAGRGQGANRWYSDAGSLTVSFVLPTAWSPQPGSLPLRMALAAAQAIERFVGPCDLQVKWPNDVLAGGRKLAGILCERVGNADVVGIGINVTTDFAGAAAEVRRLAVALNQLGAAPPTRQALVIELAAQLRQTTPATTWRESYHARLAQRDQSITLQTEQGPQVGVLRGVDEEGRLLLESAGVTAAHWTGRIRWSW